MSFLVLNPRTNSLLLKTFNNTVYQSIRQLKSALKIKWVRPEHISCLKPEMSGDLAPLGTLDMSQFPTSHKDSKELQSADELVQRIHTLEFFQRDKIKEEFVHLYTSRVKAHQLDDDSSEYQIAKITVSIRNLQIHCDKYNRDKINKVRLKEMIDKRNKWLTKLKNSDYKKFEWLLERLDIKHKVYGFDPAERVERKKSLRRLTMLYIEKLKSERLTEYKQFLDSQKEDFLKKKLETLSWIRETEENCGITSTVSDDEIKSAAKQLQDLNIAKPKEITK